MHLWRRRLEWLGLVWVLVVELHGGIALAQPAAELTFERGVQAADEGRWQAAAEAFDEVCTLAPTANALLNLATARYHLGQAAAALEALDRLDRAPDASDAERNTADKMRARVAPMVGELHVEVVPRDAAVRVDGAPLSNDEPRLYLVPGVHRVSAQADGHVPGDMELTLEAGERRTAHLQLSALAPEPEVVAPIAPAAAVAPVEATSAPNDEADEAADGRSRRRRRWLIAAAVLVVAAGAGGAVAATQAGGGSAACTEGSAGVALGGCAQ